MFKCHLWLKATAFTTHFLLQPHVRTCTLYLVYRLHITVFITSAPLRGVDQKMHAYLCAKLNMFDWFWWSCYEEIGGVRLGEKERKVNIVHWKKLRSCEVSRHSVATKIARTCPWAVEWPSRIWGVWKWALSKLVSSSVVGPMLSSSWLSFYIVLSSMLCLGFPLYSSSFSLSSVSY